MTYMSVSMFLNTAYSAVNSERSEESNFYNIDNYHKYFGWLQQCLKIIKDSLF